MSKKVTLRLSARNALSVGPALRQAIGYLEMSNAALAAALRREADAIPGLALTVPEQGAAQSSLVAHVQGQIGLLTMTPRERRIADAFIAELEPTGWLSGPVEEIAGVHGYGMDEARAVVGKLRQMEPSGLFATSLAECLRLQAQDRGAGSAEMDAVLDNLHLVAEGGLPALSRATAIDEGAVSDVLATIRTFDPKPGAAFASPDPGDLRPHDLETGPDISVRFNPDTLPRLELDAAAPARARRIEKMVARRNDLILGVAGAAVRHQADWLAMQTEVLRPLRRIDVARVASVHESTVSRAAASMTIKTPRGVLGLHRLFARPLAHSAHSHESLRKAIAQMIEDEDCACPLSDTTIASLLAASGHHVSRRSVARHRERAGIAAASRRRASK